METDICQKLVNIKSVDDIYEKIIMSYKQNEKEEEIEQPIMQTENIVEESTSEISENIKAEVVDNSSKESETIEDINQTNIVQKLEEIQEFIDENQKSFTKKDVRSILNIVNALRDDLKDLKKEL
jgi:hypothetical protein